MVVNRAKPTAIAQTMPTRIVRTPEAGGKRLCSVYFLVGATFMDASHLDPVFRHGSVAITSEFYIVPDIMDNDSFYAHIWTRYVTFSLHVKPRDYG